MEAFTLFLVLSCEQAMEQPALKPQPLRERELVRYKNIKSAFSTRPPTTPLSAQRTSIDRLLRRHRRQPSLARDLLRDPHRLVHDAALPYDAARDAPALRVLRAERLAGEDELHRAGTPDEAREALGAACAGDDAEVDLGLPEFGGGGGEEDVAHHGDFAAAAELRERISDMQWSKGG